MSDQPMTSRHDLGSPNRRWWIREGRNGVELIIPIRRMAIVIGGVAVVAGLLGVVFGYLDRARTNEVVVAALKQQASSTEQSLQQHIRDLLAQSEDAQRKLQETREATNAGVADVLQSAPEGDPAIAGKLVERLLVRPEMAGATRSQPETAAELWARGYLARQQGNNEAAREAYIGAIQKDPNYAPPYNSLGVILLGEGQYDEAILRFGQALSKDSRHGPAMANLGIAYLQSNRLPQAVLACARALQLKPPTSLALRLEQMVKGRGIECTTAAAGDHFVQAAEVDRKAGRISEGVTLLREACAEIPVSGACRELDRLCDFQEIDEACGAKPPIDRYRAQCENGNNRSCHNLARALAVRDPESAVPFYEKACNSGFSRSCQNLGTLYFDVTQLGANFEKAIEFYRKGCKLQFQKSCHDLAVARRRLAEEQR